MSDGGIICKIIMACEDAGVCATIRKGDMSGLNGFIQYLTGNH
jgi:hypothetical protein